MYCVRVIELKRGASRQWNVNLVQAQSQVSSSANSAATDARIKAAEDRAFEKEALCKATEQKVYWRV